MHSKQTQALCPACFTGQLERRDKRVTSTYRGHTISYAQPGRWCDHCDEGILTGTDALATQTMLLAWRTKVDEQQ